MAARKVKNIARVLNRWRAEQVAVTIKPGFEFRAKCVNATWKFGRVVLLLDAGHGTAWFNASKCRLLSGGE